MAQNHLPKIADVIVVGGGLAGHCAALAAVESGAEVLLVERESHVGGSTILSGGFFALAGTPMQQEKGIEDDANLLLADLRSTGGPDTDEGLLAAYATGQADLYDWLRQRGAAFTAIELSAGQSVPRSHRADPRTLIAALNARLSDSPRCTIRTSMHVTGLLRENLGGPVVGVELCDASDDSYRIAARGGVILATGGFARSEELMRIFAPGQNNALRIGGEGSRGDGLRLAWQLGAGFRDMGYVKGTFGTHPTTDTQTHKILLAFYVGAIAVNREGRRFVDESDSYKIMGDACLRQRDCLAYQILDQTIMDRSDPGVPLFDFQPAMDEGLMLRADSLEELADRIGVPSNTLIETVRRYNEGVDRGRDSDFGRDGLCNHYGAMVRLDRPPFYAYPSTTVVLATYCGLTIDSTTQVIDIANRPIRGLYAAGELTGGFHGHSYMTGTSLGKAAFFGRAAGRNAALRSRSNEC